MRVKIHLCTYQDVLPIYKAHDTGIVQIAERKKPEIWFQARSDEKIVGCGCLLMLSSKSATISRLFVLPDVRCKGICASLIKAMEQIARAINVEKLDAKSLLNFGKYGFVKKKQYKSKLFWWVKVLKK